MTTEIARGARILRPETVGSRTGAHVSGPFLARVIGVGVAVLVFAWGSVQRDLGPAEATLGIAATESIGPFGQAFGGWASSLPFFRVLPSWLLARACGPDATGSPLIVHLPMAAALLVLIWVVARYVAQTFGRMTAGLAAIALLTSPAFLERPLGDGFEPLTGLAVVAALMRIQARGSDWVAGSLAALGVLVGGWPALLMVALPIVVEGRRGRYLSIALLAPPLAAFLGWSAWALAAANPMAWGESVAGPLQGRLTVEFPVALVALGLPWSVWALLFALPGVRAALAPAQCEAGRFWLHVAGVGLLIGAFFPGCAHAAWVPVQAAVVLLATVALGVLSAISGVTVSRRWLVWGVAAMSLVWGSALIPLSSYVAAAIPYYRVVGLIVAVGGMLTVAFALVGAWEGRVRWAVGVLVAIGLLTQAGYAFLYAPEWTYRAGEGPWGRAIGQWVMPRSPIYVFRPWPPELAFATGRPFRQIVSPRWLKHVESAAPHFVLLDESEFEHWPDDAPKIVKLRAFHDRTGRRHVLALTDAPYAVLGLGDDDTRRRQ